MVWIRAQYKFVSPLRLPSITNFTCIHENYEALHSMLWFLLANVFQNITGMVTCL
jgi:hypothetical protein